MPTCQQCGQPLEASSPSCPNCGAPNEFAGDAPGAPSEAAEPVGTTGAAEPAEASEPAEPAEQSEPSTPSEPSAPSEPATWTQPAAAVAPSRGASGRELGSAERNWAVMAHLSALAALLLGLPLTFLGPLVLWLVVQDRDEFTRDQAAEALNFNLSWLIYGVVLVAGGLVLALITFGLALIPVVLAGVALAVAWLVLVVMAAVRASAGEAYRYPLTIRFLSS